ncbi:MAG TPA: FecR domain-containing protein [Puia sp.]
MKDFRLYDIADFVMDEDFIRWVQLKDPVDNGFWENWLAQNPARHLIVAEARQIVEFIQLDQRSIPAAEVQAEIGNVLQTIQQSKKKAGPDLESGPDLSPRRKRIYLSLAMAAAIILLLVITGIPRITRPQTVSQASSADALPTAFAEKSNLSDKAISFELPDGSTIKLSPHSALRYPRIFTASGSRDVYLSGEAYFSIARNPTHPFRVITGELTTRVLGTTFCIRSFEKDTTISITVHTGKVSVEGMIVTPNQQLVYHREVKKFQKILVEKPLFVVPDTVDRSMVYEDKPVQQIFDQLGKYYGISVVYDSELLSKCTVTADLSNETFYHKLDLICKAIGANYEIVDAQVVIQTNGCQ